MQLSEGRSLGPLSSPLLPLLLADARRQLPLMTMARGRQGLGLVPPTEQRPEQTPAAARGWGGALGLGGAPCVLALVDSASDLVTEPLCLSFLSSCSCSPHRVVVRVRGSGGWGRVWKAQRSGSSNPQSTTCPQVQVSQVDERTNHWAWLEHQEGGRGEWLAAGCWVAGRAFL